MDREPVNGSAISAMLQTIAAVQNQTLTEVRAMAEKVGDHAVYLGRVQSFIETTTKTIESQQTKIEELTDKLAWARGVGAAVGGGLALAEAVLHFAHYAHP